MTIEKVLYEFEKHHPGQEADAEFIREVYEVVETGYKDKRYPSGVAYLEHCLAVARNNAFFGGDAQAIAISLLHKLELDKLEQLLLPHKFKLPPQTLDIISSLQRIRLPYIEKGVDELGPVTTLQNYMKFIVQLAKGDPRILYHILADMVEGVFAANTKEKKIKARELSHIYIPLAGRLMPHIPQMVTFMQDRAFKFGFPEEYEQARNDINEAGIDYARLEEDSAQTRAGLAEIVRGADPEVRIYERIKGIANAYDKSVVKPKEYPAAGHAGDFVGMLFVLRDPAKVKDVVGLIAAYLTGLGAGIDIDPKTREERGYEATHINFYLVGTGPWEIIIMDRREYDFYRRGRHGNTYSVGPLKVHWLYKLERALEIYPIKVRQQIRPDEIELSDDFAANCKRAYDGLEGKLEVMVIQESKLSVIEVPEGAYPIDIALHPDIDISLDNYKGFTVVTYNPVTLEPQYLQLADDKPLRPGLVLRVEEKRGLRIKFPLLGRARPKKYDYTSRNTRLLRSKIYLLIAVEEFARGALDTKKAIAESTQIINQSEKLRQLVKKLLAEEQRQAEEAGKKIKKQKERPPIGALVSLLTKFAVSRGLKNIKELYLALDLNIKDTNGKPMLTIGDIEDYCAGTVIMELGVSSLNVYGIIRRIENDLLKNGFVQGTIIPPDERTTRGIIRFVDWRCPNYLSDEEIRKLLGSVVKKEEGKPYPITLVTITRGPQAQGDSPVASSPIAEVFKSTEAISALTRLKIINAWVDNCASPSAALPSTLPGTPFGRRIGGERSRTASSPVEDKHAAPKTASLGWGAPKGILFILVVCNLNLERSPIAARMISQSLGNKVVVESGGLKSPTSEDWQDTQPYRNRHHLLRGHTPQEVNADLIKTADIIFVMNGQQKKALESSFPAAKNKIELIIKGENLELDIRDYPVKGEVYQHLEKVLKWYKGEIIKTIEGYLKKKGQGSSSPVEISQSLPDVLPAVARGGQEIHNLAASSPAFLQMANGILYMAESISHKPQATSQQASSPASMVLRRKVEKLVSKRQYLKALRLVLPRVTSRPIPTREKFLSELLAGGEADVETDETQALENYQPVDEEDALYDVALGKFFHILSNLPDREWPRVRAFFSKSFPGHPELLRELEATPHRSIEEISFALRRRPAEVKQALKAQTSWLAAEQLGVSQRTLYRYLKWFNLSSPWKRGRRSRQESGFATGLALGEGERAEGSLPALPAIEVIRPERLEGLALKQLFVDFDDTLWSGFPAGIEERYWAQAMTGLQDPLPASLQEAHCFIQGTLGRSLGERFNQLKAEGRVKAQDVNPDELIIRIRRDIDEAIVAQRLTNEQYLVAGTKEFLSACVNAGLLLDVVTGGLASRRQQFAAELGINTFFTAFYGEGGKAEHIRSVLSERNLMPVQAAMLGDGAADIQAANAVGALAIGFAVSSEWRQRLIDAGADVIINRDYRAREEILRTLKVKSSSPAFLQRTFPLPVRKAGLSSLKYRHKHRIAAYFAAATKQWRKAKTQADDFNPEKRLRAVERAIRNIRKGFRLYGARPVPKKVREAWEPRLQELEGIKSGSSSPVEEESLDDLNLLGRDLSLSEIKGKTFYVRGGADVPFDKTKAIDSLARITDMARVEALIETMQYLIKNGGRIVLQPGWLGRPEGLDGNLSTYPVYLVLRKLLVERGILEDESNIFHGPSTSISDIRAIWQSREQIKSFIENELRIGQVLVLENPRFDREYQKPTPEEAKGYANWIASWADYYVAEDFPQRHRSKVPDMVLLANKIPSFAGFQLAREIKFMRIVRGFLDKKDRGRLVLILGGKKIKVGPTLKSKIQVAWEFLPRMHGGEANDIIEIGGGMSYTFMVARHFLQRDIQVFKAALGEWKEWEKAHPKYDPPKEGEAAADEIVKKNIPELTIEMARDRIAGDSYLDKQFYQTVLLAAEMLIRAEEFKVTVKLPQEHTIRNRVSGEVSFNQTQIPRGWYAIDIGSETAEIFVQPFAQAGLIVQAGPMGIIDDENIPEGRAGNRRILQAMAASEAISITAGGESTYAAIAEGVKITHKSIGGGSTFESMLGELDGVKALRKETGTAISPAFLQMAYCILHMAESISHKPQAISQQASSPIPQPLAKRLRSMPEEGKFGQRGGHLSLIEEDYQRRLRQILLEQGFSDKEVEAVSNTLVRLYTGSLNNLVEDGYLTLDQKEALVNLGAFDLTNFMAELKQDKQQYEDYEDEEGRFSQRQIFALLFKKLFSFRRIQGLLTDGLSKYNATQIVIKQSNPKDWWQRVKEIIDKIVLLKPALAKNKLVKTFIATTPENLKGEDFAIKDSQLRELLRPLEGLKKTTSLNTIMQSSSSPANSSKINLEQDRAAVRDYEFISVTEEFITFIAELEAALSNLFMSTGSDKMDTSDQELVRFQRILKSYIRVTDTLERIKQLKLKEKREIIIPQTGVLQVRLTAYVNTLESVSLNMIAVFMERVLFCRADVDEEDPLIKKLIATVFRNTAAYIRLKDIANNLFFYNINLGYITAAVREFADLINNADQFLLRLNHLPGPREVAAISRFLNLANEASRFLAGISVYTDELMLSNLRTGEVYALVGIFGQSGERFRITQTFSVYESADNSGRKIDILETITSRLDAVRTFTFLLAEVNSLNRISRRDGSWLADRVRDKSYAPVIVRRQINKGASSPVGQEEKTLDNYFRTLRRLSVVNEGIINHDLYFPGNETLTRANIEGFSPETAVKNKGGVFVGIGVGTALEYVFHSNAEDAYLINYNLLVTEVLWPILFVLFEENDDRLDFLATLLSVEFIPEEKQALRKKGVAEVIRFAWGAKPVSRDKFYKNIRRFVALLKPRVSLKTRRKLSAMVGGLFYNFLGIFSSDIRRKTGMESTDFLDIGVNPNHMRRIIDRLGGTLSSQNAYKKTREIIGRGKVKVVSGDFGGQALKRISEELNAGGRRVSLIYLSNILDWKANLPFYLRIFRNLHNLPLTGSALVLRAVDGGYTCPNQLFSEFMAMVINPDMPSRHPLKFRIYMSWALLRTIPLFMSPKIKIRWHTFDISELYRTTVNIHRIQPGAPKDAGLLDKTDKFYKFFSRGNLKYKKGQFRNRDEFRTNLADNGVIVPDPFDFELAAKVFEVIGIIQRLPPASSPVDKEGPPDPAPLAANDVVFKKSLGPYDSGSPLSQAPADDAHRLAREARGLMDAGQINQARALLESGTRQFPDDHIIWNFLAVAYRKQGMTDDAIQAGETSVRLQPEDPWSRATLANIYLSAKRFEEARVHSEYEVKLQPARAKPHGVLATIYHALGRHDEAIHHDRISVGLDPQNWMSQIAVAEWELRAKRHEEAVARAAYILLHARNSLPAMRVFCVGLLRLGRVEHARQAARAFVRAAPNSAMGYRLLAQAELAAGRLAEALAEAEQAVARDAKASWNHRVLGQVYKAQHNWAAAATAFNTAWQLEPDDGYAYVEAANAYLNTGDAARAAELASIVASRWPDGHPAALDILARAQLALGQGIEALTQARMAVERNPKDSYAHTTLGVALLAEDNLSPAIQEFITALELNPGNYRARELLAVTYARQGRFAEAFREAQALVGQGVTDAAESGYRALARIHQERGEWEQAIDSARTAVKLARHNSSNWAALVYSLVDAGRTTEAEQAVREGMAAAPGHKDLQRLADRLTGSSPAASTDKKEESSSPVGALVKTKEYAALSINPEQTSDFSPRCRRIDIIFEKFPLYLFRIIRR